MLVWRQHGRTNLEATDTRSSARWASRGRREYWVFRAASELQLNGARTYSGSSEVSAQTARGRFLTNQLIRFSFCQATLSTLITRGRQQSLRLHGQNVTMSRITARCRALQFICIQHHRRGYGCAGGVCRRHALTFLPADLNSAGGSHCAECCQFRSPQTLLLFRSSSPSRQLV